MIIKLEINTEESKDIIDSLNLLKTFIKSNTNENIEGKKIEEKQDICSFKEEPKIEEILPEGTDLKTEIRELTERIEDLNKQKLLLIQENEKNKLNENELNNKITELEKEKKSLNDELKQCKITKNECESLEEKLKQYETLEGENGKLKEDIKNLKEQQNINDEKDKTIEELRKQVSFHESRSNKNFEDNKKLRGIVDNLTVEQKKSKSEYEEKITDLQNKLDEASKVEIPNNTEEITNLNKQIEDTNKEKDELSKEIEKLKKDVDFHKDRSNKNWEEVKNLRNNNKALENEKNSLYNQIKELKEKENQQTPNSDELEKIKKDSYSQKSKYESQISELKLDKDKIANELALLKLRFKDEDFEELKNLRNIKKLICGNEKGKTFWENIETKMKI